MFPFQNQAYPGFIYFAGSKEIISGKPEFGRITAGLTRAMVSGANSYPACLESKEGCVFKSSPPFGEGSRVGYMLGYEVELTDKWYAGIDYVSNRFDLAGWNAIVAYSFNDGLDAFLGYSQTPVPVPEPGESLVSRSIFVGAQWATSWKNGI